MADRVKKVTYCYAKVSTRAGHGARLLQDIREADVNLLAFSGFPAGRGKAQLDFVTQDMAAVRRLSLLPALGSRQTSHVRANTSNISVPAR